MGAEDSENSPSDLESGVDDSSADDEATQVDLASSSSDSERDATPSSTAESHDKTSQSIEDMLLEFDEQEGLIRDRSLLDPNYVVEEDRIVGRSSRPVGACRCLEFPDPPRPSLPIQPMTPQRSITSVRMRSTRRYRRHMTPLAPPVGG